MGEYHYKATCRICGHVEYDDTRTWINETGCMHCDSKAFGLKIIEHIKKEEDKDES